MKALCFVFFLLLVFSLPPHEINQAASQSLPSVDQEPNTVYLPVILHNYISGMVFVPAGDFQMGCDPGHNAGFPNCDQNSNEYPLHTVYLSSYFIDVAEVTNAQYSACVVAGVCPLPAYLSSIVPGVESIRPKYHRQLVAGVGVEQRRHGEDQGIVLIRPHCPGVDVRVGSDRQCCPEA